MQIRELVTRLGFDVDFGPLNKFDDKISDTKDGLESMGAAADEAVQQFKSALVTIRNTLIGFTVATAAGAAGLVAIVKSAANAGDEINKVAPMLGFTTEEFQKYRYAAKLAGVENENFAGSVQLLLRNVAEANNGNKEIAKSFARAGIAAGDLKNLSTDQILRRLSDGLSAIPNEAERVSVSMDLLGRSGARMGQFLAKGTAEMDAIMGDVEAFGLFSKESAQQAEDFNDAWDRVGFFISGIKNEFMGLFPVFTGMLNDFREWLSLHREVIKAGMAKAVEVLTNVIQKSWNVVKRVVKGFETLVKAMGGVENAFYLMAIAILAPLTLLLGPVVLLTKATLFLLIPFIRLHTLLAVVGFAMSAIMPIFALFTSIVSALAATKLVGWMIGLAGGYRALAAAIIIPTLALLAQAAALAAIIILFEDLTTWILGGKSMIGTWIGEWEAVPDKLRKVWETIKKIFLEGGRFMAAVFKGDFAEAYRILEKGGEVVKKVTITKPNTLKGRTGEEALEVAMNVGGMGAMAPGSRGGFMGYAMAGGKRGPSGVGNGPGFARAFQPGDVMDMQGNYLRTESAPGAPVVHQNNKVELNLNMPKGTPQENAEEIVRIVNDTLSNQADHALQQSVAPGR